ncbi:Hsp70 family protein [Corynebacterium macclintockiae]|uniref:Hsp70 family protein n=1 Tax=Corynebacterium macclintockiae TaxID=2913501 RepID=UPI00254B3947|nr:Hsp70 family protein [Corynebacterium macclintockiae]MDK8869707.1 Hsp70 family protein [Corynebacterium macclintockiae]
MTNAWHLAIDFGTSNTAAAHQSPMGKEISALALTHRSNILPSAVFLDSPHGAHAAADGEPTLLNGDSALARGRRDPSRLLLSPKRYIDHDEVKLAAKDLPLTKVVGSVLATVLRSGKAQHANKDPETVTLTHPEAWSAHSVDQLKRSAIAAGIPEKSLRFLSEPRAAAIHYASQQSVRAGSHVAVFDFGGGTLDIAVLEAKPNGNFEVVAAKGDNSLGGRTIDNLMYRWVLDQLEHDDPDLADYLRSAPIATVHALESSIREAKEILSDTSSATISVSTPHGETDLLITRDEFNNVIEQSIMRGVELTRAALAQAGVDSTKTPIYMTGGSSRVPFVQDRLGEVGTVMTLDDPKTVVSRGALAATLRGFTDGGAPDSANRTANAGGAAAGVAGAAGAAGAASAATGGGAAAGGSSRPTPATSPGMPRANQNGSSPTSSFPNPAQNNTQSFSRPPQASSFGPGAPSSYGPSNFASARATATSAGRKKSNTPVIVTASLAILAVVVAIGFVALNGGGDGKGGGNGGGSDDSGNPPFSETSTFALPANATDSDLYKVLPTLLPEVKDYMPTNFYNRMRTCEAETKKPPFLGDAFRNMDNKMYSCLPDYNSLDGKNGNLTYSGFRYILTGDEAKKVYDHAESSSIKSTKIQDAGNGWPEIRMYPATSEYGAPDIMIWYPDQKGIVVSRGENGASEDEIKKMLKFFNLMPQD